MTEPHPDVPSVRGFWEPLGLPGLFDVHVHFLPPNIQRAVYAVFDSAGPKIGRAHMGAPESAEFLALAERYDEVRLDTTMVFTDFLPPYPAELVPRLRDLGHPDRGGVLLGSDFPTIPYPYAHQLEGLARLDLGDDWLRAVCWENGRALFGR